MPLPHRVWHRGGGGGGSLGREDRYNFEIRCFIGNLLNLSEVVTELPKEPSAGVYMPDNCEERSCFCRSPWALALATLSGDLFSLIMPCLSVP